MLDVTDRNELQNLIDQGLRAQLGLVGLATGLLYVELDFMDPRQYPADPRLTDVKYAVVPAMPSAISEFQQNLQEIVTDLKHVDFVGLAGELRALLATARQKADALDTRAMSESVTQAAAAFVAVQGAFNWLIDNFPRLAECLSSANRVGNLLLAFDQLEVAEVVSPLAADSHRKGPSLRP